MNCGVLFPVLLALVLCRQAAWTAETVVRVTDINPGPLSAYPSWLTVFRGALYFRATTGQTDVELWRFDGATAERVADIVPGLSGSSPANLVEFGSALYFDARTVAGGMSLHRYDGTNVSVLTTNPRAFYGSGLWRPVVWLDELWFVEEGELYHFNGVRFARLNAPPWINSQPVLYNGSLYYRAQEPDYGDELWRYNRSVQERVSDIRPGPDESYPEWLFVHRGKLYFRAQDSVSGAELWRHHGSVVERVADINGGSTSSNPSGLVTFQDDLYFSADDGAHGHELFRWDGNTVTLAADVNPNPVYERDGDRLSDSWPRSLTVLGPALYFIATDGTHTGLWRFDGTNAVVLGGGLLNNVSEIVLYNNELYFDANDDLFGRELWKVERSPTPHLTIDLHQGQVRVLLREAETGNYVIQTSGSLTDWDSVVTNRPIDGQVILRDGPLTNAAQRLYRTVRVE